MPNAERRTLNARGKPVASGKSFLPKATGHGPSAFGYRLSAFDAPLCGAKEEQ